MAPTSGKGPNVYHVNHSIHQGIYHTLICMSVAGIGPATLHYWGSTPYYNTDLAHSQNLIIEQCEVGNSILFTEMIELCDQIWSIKHIQTLYSTNTNERAQGILEDSPSAI